MNEKEMKQLQYPIGKFIYDSNTATEHVETWINEIAGFPQKLFPVVEKLTPEQLDTPYRPGGWTVRQLVYHIGDSHLNSLIRFKWTLTEDTPTIKAYNQDGWASINDYKMCTIQESLGFIRYLHIRFAALLRLLTKEQLELVFIHPEIGNVSLKQAIGLYAWHGNHHLAHITSLIHREGW